MVDIGREDIPLGSLHTQFNCNFSIVSQTNPHIHLFFFAPRGSVGKRPNDGLEAGPKLT